MSRILRTTFKAQKICLHRILEAQVITIGNTECQLKITYNTMPYIETAYKIETSHKKNRNITYIPYDKVNFDIKKTILEYPEINLTFANDIEFLIKWDVDIISDTDIKTIIKNNNNETNPCRLVC